MLRERADHNCKLKSINGDYMRGQYLDGLYLGKNGMIYMTVSGRGKAHFAVIGSSATVCDRGTSKMGSTCSLNSRSKPMKVCKNCLDTAKMLNLRFISGGWHDVPLLTRLHSFGMLKDGFNRLRHFKGLKPFEMRTGMNRPYVMALTGGERLSGVDTKVYLDRDNQLTGIEELHSVVLSDVVEAGAKSHQVGFDFMKFYPVAGAFNSGGEYFVNSLSDELEKARDFLGYDLLESGVLVMKSKYKLDLFHTLAFKVVDKSGSGIISLSWVPHDKPLGGVMCGFDRCMSRFGALVKVGLGSAQKWAI